MKKLPIGEWVALVLFVLLIVAMGVYLYADPILAMVDRMATAQPQTHVASASVPLGPVAVFMAVSAVGAALWAFKGNGGQSEGSEVDRSCPKWVDVKIV